MYIDKETLLCDEQVFTASAVSQNAYDTGGVDGHDVSTGEPIGIGIVPVDAAATAGTYEFRAIQSVTGALGSPDVLISRIIPAAQLSAGAVHVLPLPAGAVSKRYIGVSFVGGAGSNVKVKAWIAPLSFFARWKAHATGYYIHG